MKIGSRTEALLYRMLRCPISYCVFEVSTITVCVYHTVFRACSVIRYKAVKSYVQLLKKYKNLIKKPLLDEAFLRPRTLFYHPLFMLLVCNNVTRKTKCYKKNTVLLNSQKGLLLFLNCDKIVW